MKLSYSFHFISYVPFPFYGLWVFYFTGVKQGVSSGPRWFIWSPRFSSQVLIILFFTFSSLFHPKFAFILCIVWGRGSTLFSCIWIELCQHKSPQITVLIREIVNVQCMNNSFFEHLSHSYLLSTNHVPCVFQRWNTRGNKTELPACLHLT